MTNEEQILEILKQNQEMIAKTYASAEKMRKYFLYSLLITIVMFVLPLIGLIIVIPMFINTYVNTYQGLI
ncbi:MAG: hypothetical protein WA063_06285 [Minisyncoccia bacterium]